MITLQPGGEPQAAGNVATLRVRVELACSHVLDHALTQWTDSFSVTHESSILSEADDTSILGTGLPTPLWPSCQLATGLSPFAPRSGLGRSDVVHWHIADHVLAALKVRYGVSSSAASYFDECPASVRKKTAVNDDPFHLIEAVLVAPAVLNLFARVEACFAIVGALLELGARGLIKFPVPSPALILAACAGYERGFQTTPRRCRSQHQNTKITLHNLPLAVREAQRRVVQGDDDG